jgi:YggT family protein
MDFLLIVFRAVDLILSILSWTILVWVVLSWILFFLRNSQFRWRHRGFYGILETLNDLFERMTRPFLRPIRRWMRRFDTAGIDWSPMVFMLLVWLLREILRTVMVRLYTVPV